MADESVEVNIRSNVRSRSFANVLTCVEGVGEGVSKTIVKRRNSIEIIEHPVTIYLNNRHAGDYLSVEQVLSV